MANQTRQFELDHPALFQPTFSLLRRGAGDPTHRKVGEVMLRATRTPAGPALIKIIASGRRFEARAWGDGAEWALDQLPKLAGADDDPDGFRPLPQHPVLVHAHRRYSGYRVGRSDAVFEALAPACLEQVVTGAEAFRAWRLLVREFGESAPGPAQDPSSIAFGMRLPPAPEVWARVPSWRFLAAGVEQRRSRTLANAAPRAAALERTLHREPRAANLALRSLPGVGPWTSAEVRQRAHGDPDAWSIGDYHVGKEITYALTGEALDDDACTEILEPYRGHRFRVQMLLVMAGFRVPRRAPRMSLPTHTPYATHGRS
ncbi:MAG TPA: DNA-3-methyladenine glycosylase 2 family protein [Propionibacteriaceae bacterium]|jgi:3-methyladenine DNA glycosylase/8-oxoguanine DNA glycosylase|nr:DNA-3-methyladenine glycosylase 2 family protein [Propionibacteriaceae bacterium]